MSSLLRKVLLLGESDRRTSSAPPGDCRIQHRKPRKLRRKAGMLASSGVRAPEHAIPAPPFPRELTWVNVAPLRMDKQIGRPVLVEFWDFCRVNNLRTLPYVKAWHERYAQDGLRVIGVHAGGFAPARDTEA